VREKTGRVGRGAAGNLSWREVIGRHTWFLIHSAAAVYPDAPSDEDVQVRERRERRCARGRAAPGAGKRAGERDGVKFLRAERQSVTVSDSE
jgi:hypothetical protein